MVLKFLNSEPSPEDVHEQQLRRPSAVDAAAHARVKKAVSNKAVTGASQLTLKQSIIPVALVTILFFCWGFAYGLLDVLNIQCVRSWFIGNARYANAFKLPNGARCNSCTRWWTLRCIFWVRNRR